jgi:hypothetical protein
MNFSSKKLFFIGFVVILLVGIPLSIYLLQQQQEVRSRAEKSTNISFSPDSTASAPIQKSVNDSIPLDVTVDPGKNLVDHVKLIIQYDPEVLATASANAFKANAVAFPSTLEGPVYSLGKIAVSLAVGSDPTKAIQQKVTAATITFKALKNTPAGTPTLVTFTTETQVLSIGSNDQASENVLSSATPATIVIGGSTTVTPTAPAGTIVPTSPASTPQPTDIAPTSVSTTVAPTSEVTAVPTTPISDTGTPGTPPVCNSLTVDRETTGNAPLSITFGANGSDVDGTISKVTFNFGDSQVSDVTSSGGIGTASVNVQASHTYNNTGTYQASVVLTDSSNGVSTASDTCKQTITVTSAGSGGGGNNGGGTVDASPTMPATGSTQVAMGIGIGTLILVLGGGLLFFML